MTVRCNICNVDIDEKEVETHVKSRQHEQSKSGISSSNNGLDTSVVKTWYNSLND